MTMTAHDALVGRLLFDASWLASQSPEVARAAMLDPFLVSSRLVWGVMLRRSSRVVAQHPGNDPPVTDDKAVHPPRSWLSNCCKLMAVLLITLVFLVIVTPDPGSGRACP